MSMQKGRLLLAGVAILVSLCDRAIAASPQENGTAIAKQMLGCLKLPPDAPATYSYRIVMQLTNGTADLVRVGLLAPPTQWDMDTVPKIADAITDCEPYGAISGPVVLLFNEKFVQ